MNVTRYKCSALVVDDDPAILEILSSQLAEDFEVIPAISVGQARLILAQRSVDILVTDLHLTDASGIDLLDWVRRTTPRTARVLLTGTARLEDTVDAINQSQIHRLVLKPWRADDLLQTLRSTARALLLERSHEQLLDELRKLNLELEERVLGRTLELEKALRQLQHKNQILEKMALTDALTGLPNRRAIDLIARKELLRRTRVPSNLSLALVDADHFKSVNTRYELTGGDQVLIWLANTLQSSVREADSLGRVGGEEFMIVAPGADRGGAEVLGERIRVNVADGSTTYKDSVIRCTVSIGFAVADTNCPAGFEQIRETAAGALREAKESGRNRCVVRAVPGDIGG